MAPRAHACDLRKGRFSQPGQIYLVTTVTEGRLPVFADFHIGRLAVESLRFCAGSGRADTFAFVIMPDHLHWLLSLGESHDLSAVVGGMKQRTAYAVNTRLCRTGTALWKAGFHDRALRREEDLEAVARYVVANPLRAGLVRRIGEYPLWDAAWL